VNFKNCLLKKDLFGEVWKIVDEREAVILRDARPARWWLAWIARALLRREANILAALDTVDGVPHLLRCDRSTLRRSYVPGVPMYEGRPDSREFYKKAFDLLRKMHCAGVVHNDLAKEPNILVRDDGTPAFIDFQLAVLSRKRGRVFRAAGREDIRHLLKHKRTYRPDLISGREQRILDSPSTASRVWMSTFKPVYLFVTRRLLNWSDREGAADRGKLD